MTDLTMTEGQRLQVERAAVAAAELAHEAGLSEDAVSRAAVEAAECAFEGLMTRDTMTDQQLLRAAIDAAGGSARAFAKRPLLRNERTIRRWLKGEQPLPKEVRDYLVEVLTPADDEGR